MFMCRPLHLEFFQVFFLREFDLFLLAYEQKAVNGSQIKRRRD